MKVNLFGFNKISTLTGIVNTATLKTRTNTFAAEAREQANLEPVHVAYLHIATHDFEQPLIGVDVKAPKRYMHVVVPEKLLVSRLTQVASLARKCNVK